MDKKFLKFPLVPQMSVRASVTSSAMFNAVFATAHGAIGAQKRSYCSLFPWMLQREWPKPR